MGRVESELQRLCYSTSRNEPFSGTIVPLKHYRKNQRAQSLKIEINRKLCVKENYSVDRASVQKVVMAMDSVREKLTGKDFFAF